ncbi:MAG: cell division protein SepF [Oscillospiraceae bacterium]|nr:cell division protein SepF [Oscillospiraceae bacterium]
MSLLDGLLRLTRPYSEDDEESVEILTSRSQSRAADLIMDTKSKNDSKVVNIHTTTQLQVMLMKPDRFESAAEVADHLREKRTVVLNLESANKEISRRLIDFLSGVAYAQEGKIKKIANSTYIITPYNVDILGDLLDELESAGMYF